MEQIRKAAYALINYGHPPSDKTEPHFYELGMIIVSNANDFHSGSEYNLIVFRAIKSKLDDAFVSLANIAKTHKINFIERDKIVETFVVVNKALNEVDKLIDEQEQIF